MSAVTLLVRIALLPLRIVWFVLRIIGSALGKLFTPVLKRIDKSRRLSTVISSLSSSMATQRGLLLMLGTGIVLLSLVAHGVMLVMMVATGSFDRHLYWLCIPFTLFHVGVLSGFVGIMLAVPLGQGYKSQQ